MTRSHSKIHHTVPAPLLIGVGAQSNALAESASRIAAALALPMITPKADETGFDLVLKLGTNGLSLVPTDPTHGGGIRIDFVHGPTAYRRLAAGSTRQPLAKAIGLRRGRPTVIDATAGLGRDAFLLAVMGYRVYAIERSPILSAMLIDALARAALANDPKLTAIVGRITIVSGDSKTILRSIPDEVPADVVYLDPMYTPRATTALAKKEMRILRMLVGNDDDSDELLQIARATATKHVVVKRHLRAPPLADGVIRSYPGRTVRYDVYPVFPSDNA